MNQALDESEEIVHKLVIGAHRRVPDKSGVTAHIKCTCATCLFTNKP